MSQDELSRGEPALSVVLSNYNHARYIGEALEAILAQSFRPRELIVVDDASTDNSVEVIQEFVRRDGIVSLLRNERNVGVNRSANHGLAHASGDYVIFAAADDKVLPGLFEKSMKLLAQYPQAGLCSAVAVVADERGNGLHPTPRRPWVSKTPCYLPPDKALAAWRRYGWWFAGSTTIYRHDAMLKAGGFPPDLGGLADLFPLLGLALKYGACFIPEPLAMFRLTGGNVFLETQSYKAADGLYGRWLSLMRTNDNGLFPEEFVAEFERDLPYLKANSACQQLYREQKESLTQLEHVVENPMWLDKLLLRLLRFSAVVQRFLALTYLHTCLSHRRRLTVKQILWRMREYAGPHAGPFRPADLHGPEKTL